MKELVGIIVAETGLKPAQAEEALGILLNLVKTQGHPAKAAELLARLDGADALVAQHAPRLTGLLAGGMMGGPLAALTKLQAIGISMENTKLIGKALLDHARTRAGDDLVRQAAANIPGLSGFL